MSAIKCPACNANTIVDPTITFEDGDVFECDSCRAELKIRVETDLLTGLILVLEQAAKDTIYPAMGPQICNITPEAMLEVVRTLRVVKGPE